MTELAESVYSSQSGITYQITQLEKHDLVQRRHGDTGPRAVYAVLTDAGSKTLKRAARAT
ncbi:MarR family protein [Kribbella sp. VKM Ac-2527]|uniref:MarR family protein n=1 Tax=Kribbella caucasensis TaxID=2512215 RepID=A0A4R6KHJ8_9ACTN|nr:MarR family transcriptional regulator [Kribbella sp. VKM Ac-2527]TDO50550.1 MarR family protein [Kribbella sp. VKM Ac-2527]